MLTARFLTFTQAYMANSPKIMIHRTPHIRAHRHTKCLDSCSWGQRSRFAMLYVFTMFK